MPHAIFQRVLIPIAGKVDARATTQALAPYLETDSQAVIAVHVIEKAGGAPDKASVEQRELAANEMFDIVAEGLDDIDIDLQTEYLYGTDVAATIIEAAHDFDADAIVFTPRGGSRWFKLLTGDVTKTLVSESDLPIVALPDRPEDDTDQ